MPVTPKLSTEDALTTLRDAREIRWHPFTVFESGRGADGSLVADGAYVLPLDIYSPAELTRGITPPICGGVGIVIAEPKDVRAAQGYIKQWCRTQLGRDDIVFDPWGERS